MTFYCNTVRSLEFGLCYDFVDVDSTKEYHDELIDYKKSKTLFVYGDPKESETSFIYDYEGKERLMVLEKFTDEKPYNDISFVKPIRYFRSRYPKTCKFTCVWYLDENKNYEYKIYQINKDDKIQINFDDVIKTYLLIAGKANMNDIKLESSKFYRKTKKENVILTADQDKTFVACLYRT